MATPPKVTPPPMDEAGIVCNQSRWSKSIFPAVMIGFGLALGLGMLPARGLLFIIWLNFIPFMLTYSPDFTVYEDGIEVRFPWRTLFNTWEQVEQVRKTAINTRIYAQNLTFFNYVFGFGRPWIVATAPGRSNYDAAIAYIRAQVSDRFNEVNY